MRREMLAADRMGVAQLARMSAGGIDLHPLWQVLINRLLGGTIEPGEGMDLSDRKSTRLNSSHSEISRMPSSA